MTVWLPQLSPDICAFNPSDLVVASPQVPAMQPNIIALLLNP